MSKIACEAFKLVVEKKGAAMIVEELKNYKVKSITTATSELILGKPCPVVDEGYIYRIAELHVIMKTQIEKIEENSGTMRITYKNGEVDELEVEK